MVAIVSGNNLGLNLGSLASLGTAGQFGNAALGQSGERAYVNVSTGNLVLQEMDTALFGVGTAAATVRTYNSQGQFDNDNGDGWRGAPYRSVLLQADGTLLRTDSDGSTNTFTWDADKGAFIGVIGASQALDRITVDGSGDYVFTDGTSGRFEVYQASGAGLVRFASDTNGNTLAFTYNASDRLVRVENEAGEAVNYSYTGANLTQVSTALAGGQVVTELNYSYDASNRLRMVSVTLNQSGNVPAGAESSATYTTTYTYSGTSTRVATVTQGDGTKLSFGYVLSGGVYKVSSVTDGLGRITRFAYNATTRTTTVTDALGVASSYRYDTSGNLSLVKLGVTASNPNGLTQLTYRYDQWSNVLDVTDGLGQTIGFEYDDNGNQTLQTDALGNRLERRYDSNNQLVSETVYPQQNNPLTSRYVYDAAGHNRLRFTVSADGRVTEHRYDDATGLRTSSIRYTAGVYDLSGVDVLADLDESGLEDWVAQQDASRTELSEMAYDHRGQLQTLTSYDEVEGSGAGVGRGSATFYVYDQKGELLQTISPDGAGTTQMVYDGLGRLVSSSTHATGGSLDVTTLTQYDDTNARSTITLANGLHTVSTYDRAGRVTSVTQNAGGPALGTTRYVYDRLGNLAMTEGPTGQRSFMLYDQAGRQVADIGPDGQIVEYVYDADSRLTQTVAYADRADVSLLVDGTGQPLTQWNANPARAPAGVTAVTLDSLRAPGDPGQRTWNFYDDADHLTFQVDALGYATQTQYDGAGRVVGVNRLATPVDLALLADGRRIELLLGGYATTTSLWVDIVGGEGAGPNAPRALNAYVGSNRGDATGFVSFYAGGRLLGTERVWNGNATLVVSNLPPGTDEITAVYSGDAANLGSTSGTDYHEVLPAEVTTTVLEASTASTAAGASLTLTATVTGADPQGLVTFYSGNRALAVASVVNGVASAEVNDLPAGSRVLTASYQGDDWNAASSSAAITEVVTRALPVTTETVVTLLANNRSTLPGAPVTLTAQVAGANPGGLVNFYNGATLLGVGTVVAGLASLTVSNLPVGVDRLRARYMGDTQNAASYSAYVNTVVLAPATVSVSASAAGTPLGAPVTLTASVGGTSPGGVVSFFRGAQLLGSAFVSAGQASLTLADLPLGGSTIEAVYSGDAVNAFASSSFTVTVTPAATTTVLSTSAATSALGASLVLTATVSGTGTPGGSVTFYNGASVLGTASVADGVASLAVADLPQGTASLTAVFDGDAGNITSTSAAVDQAIAAADYTATTLALSCASATYGAPLTLTAQVAGAGSIGGTITFYNGATAIGTASVVDGVASLSVSSLPAGTAALSASYGGETGHAASVSAAVTATISAVTTALGLASSAASSPYGAPVTLTATLAGGAGASGTVTFFNLRTVIGTASLVNGVASLTLDNLPAGNLSLSAAYSGDAGNAGSVATLAQSVTPASTSITLSATRTSAAQGVAVVFTARVTSSTTSRPAGTVTFYNGAIAIGTGTVNNGYAAITLNNLPAGAGVITASYAGDARNASSVSAGLVETITAAPTPSVTTLSSSVTTAPAGSTFTLTATITGASPGGTVTFVNGFTVLGTAVVDTSGVATLNASVRTTGTASIYATYAGDAANAGSVSARVPVSVTAAALPPAPPAPPASTTTLTASVASAIRGDPVTLFARVTSGSPGVVPGGTVAFYSGTTLVGSAELASGQATLTLGNLPVGSGQLRAVYSGDPAAATSTSALLAESISLAPSSITLTQSVTTAVQGSAVLLTAQVAGNVAPGGTVTFYAGATVLATVAVVNGLASRNVTTLPVGASVITARYNGDANNAVNTSASSGVTVTAAPAASTVALAASVPSSALGETLTLTATIAGASPQGTVSFFNNNTLLGSASVVAGQAVFDTHGLPRGTANLRAVYSGDAGNTTSTSTVVTETVTTAATVTTLVASTDVSPYGSALVLTANVTGTGAPAGTVRFYNGTVLLGSVALSSGQASLSVSSLAVGTGSLTAVYLGNANNTTSTSAVVSEAITRAPSTLVAASAAPVSQLGPISVQVGGVSPAGVVTFLEGDVVLGVATVVAGVATLAANTLGVGLHQLSATYGGDARNAASVLHFEQEIVPTAATVTLQPSTPYVAQNAPLVLTARVAGSDPTGSVTFYNDGIEIGAATLVNGIGAITLASLDDGLALLSVTYSGDANNAAAVSDTIEERVILAPVNVTVSASSASVPQGQPVTLTAQVSGDNPTGEVMFVSGRVTLGSALIIDGVATLDVARLNLPVGAQDIIAVYAGDGNNLATLSPVFSLSVTPGIADVYAARDQWADRQTTLIVGFDGQLLGSVDAEGYLTEMEYDAAGRLVHTIRYDQRVDSFDDASMFPTLVANAQLNGNLDGLRPQEYGDRTIQTYLIYNARGQQVGEVDGEGYLTERVYDANGRLTQQIRYANRVTAETIGTRLSDIRPDSSPQDSVQLNTWDALGRLSTQTNAEGTVTGYSYDNVGRVVATQLAMNTAELRTLTVRYDVQGNLVAELSPEGAALLTGGQTQAQVDAVWAGHGLRHTYDAAGRRTSTTDANGLRTVFFYDDASRLRYRVNAMGEVSERRYGDLGRLSGTVAHELRLDAGSLAAMQGGLLAAAGNELSAQALANLDSDDDSVASFHYDEVGNLSESYDAQGNRTGNDYNAFGELVESIQDGDEVTGERGVYNEYDRRGLATYVENFGDDAYTSKQLNYDAFGRVTSYDDGNGVNFRTQYDRLGRVIETRDGERVHRYTSYDAFDRVLTQTDGNGEATQFSYDRAARTMTLTTPEGISVSTAHTRLGQVHSVTDGNGNTTAYSYDHNGNLTGTESALTDTSAQFDGANRLLRTVDANGVAVEYGYDAANRLLTRTLDPDGLALQLSYGYDAKGRQVQATDANGVVTVTGYDLDGRVLTQTVDPSGLNLTTSYRYDVHGDVLRVTSPGGTETSYVYDGLGRRIEEHQDPDGLDLVCLYAYDANGNVTAKTDANGFTTTFTYDRNNRLVFTADGVTGVRENIYDDEGRLVRTIVHVNAFEVEENSDGYPSVGEPSPNDVINDYLLDRDGRVQYHVDGAGGVTEYFRDGNGNVVRQVTYAQAVQREWEGSYPPVQAGAGDRELRTVYDALNRATWSCDGAGDVTHTEYDANGNVLVHVAYTSKVDPGAWSPDEPYAPADPAHDLVTRAVYDAANRAVFTVDGTGALLAQSYDGNGNVVDRVAYANRLPGGTPVTASALTAAAGVMADSAHDAHIRRIYDAAGRLAWSVDGVGAVTSQRYDANGNLIEQVAYAGTIAGGASPDSVAGSGDDRVMLMAYDTVNRKSFQVDALGGVVRFDYDGVGNMTRRTEYAARAPQPYAGADAVDLVADVVAGWVWSNDDNRVTQAAYDGASRLRYSVDAEGGVVETRYDGASNAVASIAYAERINFGDLNPDATVQDLENRVVAGGADRLTLRAFDGAGRALYSVDGLGYVTASVYDGGGQLLSSTLYAASISGQAPPGLDLAGNREALAQAIVADPDHDRTDSYTYDGGGWLVASTDALDKTEYYVRDGAGNKTAFTNKNGASWSYDYDAAGRLVRETAPEVDLAGEGSTAIVTHLRYDALGNLLSRTEAEGLAEQRTTDYEYDALGRQVKTIFPPVDVYDAGHDDLAVNGANGLATRRELQDQRLFTEVSYDVFGQAVASRDVAGNYSYKAYDRLGRVGAEVDAMGYVTGYERDTFGDAVAVTRFAGQLTLPDAAASQQVSDAVSGLGEGGGRTITTRYDGLGRAVEVREPTVYVHNSPGSGGYYAQKVTETEYNAFGQVRSTGIRENSEEFSATTNYYNRRGDLVGVKDPMGYLTTMKYDAAGNVISRREWANSFAGYADSELPLGGVSAGGGGGPDPIGTVYNPYDAITSSNTNPNGVWTLGWKSSHGSYDFTPFDVNYPGTDNIWTASWSDSGIYYTPYVGAETEGGTMMAQPGPNGEVAVLRWTAPRVPGQYSYNFDVVSGGTTTRRVYLDNVALIGEGDTSGYLNAGGAATLDFEIGNDGDFWGDGTYFNVQIVLAGAQDGAQEGGGDPGGVSDVDHPNANIDDRTTLYEYDQLNRLTLETRKDVEHSHASDGSVVNDHEPAPAAFAVASYDPDHLDITTSYEYDAVGNLLATTDDLDQTTRSTYDALGRVTSVIAPERTAPWYGTSSTSVVPTTYFHRDAYGNVVMKVERGAADAAADRVTSIEYDTLGHAVHSTDAAGYEQFMSYDARGQIAKQWQGVAGNDGVTHTAYTFLEYDKVGRQTDIVTPGTNSVVDGGNIVTIDQAAAGVVHTRSEYNAYGELVRRGTYADGDVRMDERYEYDDAGHLVRTDAGDGNWKFMLYNLHGYQTAQITSAGGDSGADLSLVTAADAADSLSEGVRRTDVEVDLLGRAVAQHLPERFDPMYEWPLAPVIYQTFDRWGNVLSQTDPRDTWLVTTFRYNANNQVVEQVRPNVSWGIDYYGGFGQATTRIRYDALGRQVAVIDANGHINGQRWDSGDNLVEELHADGGVVRYGYDVFGNRTQLVDAEGRRTDYSYDQLGRLGSVSGEAVQVATAAANYDVNVVTSSLGTQYTYDAAGRKLTARNGAGEVTKYTYDLRGNVVATELPMGQVSKAAFDESGRQIGAQDPNLALSTWSYDSFGQLQGYRDIGGKTHFMEYDNARQLTRHSSTRGQDIRYGYDAAGQLVQIQDLALGQLTSYRYDAAGHRTREYMEQGGTVYQDNRMEYDALGRLDRIDSLDGVAMFIDYDAVGNKHRQLTRGDSLARSVESSQQVLTGYDEGGSPIYTTQTTYQTVYDATQQDFWYAYDAMNRQILVDGLYSSTDLSTANINGSQGHIITYDLNGNRKSDTHWGQQVTKQHVVSYDEAGNPMYVSNPTVPGGGQIISYDESSTTIERYVNREGAITEYYDYDRMNRLATVSTGGFDSNLQPLDKEFAIVLDRRYYDGAGRMVRNGPAGELDPAYIELLNQGGKPDANGAITRTNQYDANGRLTAQRVQKPNGDLSYEIEYRRANGTSGYDEAGNVVGYRVHDSGGVTSTYSITLGRFEGYKEATVSGFRSDNTGEVRTTTNHYDANGFLTSITDDTGSTAAFRTFVNDTNGVVLQKTQEGNLFKQVVVGGQVYASYGMAEDPRNPGQYTNQSTFDPHFQPVTNGYPSAATGTYTVRAGDTLEAIAQAAYGDSQLWYVIADANGMRSNADLRVGQTLNLPLKVGSIHNTGDTFKPYNPSEIIGQTTPNLPVPQSDDDCGGFGQIIMIIVAVVVTIITEGATTEFLISALGEAAGTVAAAAVGAAAGSIASQVVGNAIGAVHGFSWKQVALAALTAGVTKGVGMSNFLPDTGSAFGNAAVRQAVGSAMTQGIAVATGLQDHFSWKAVAASAVSAGVSAEVGPAFGEAFGAGSFGARFATNLVAGTARAVMQGGRISVRQIVTDSFGNALGDSLAPQSLQVGQQEERLDEIYGSDQQFAGAPGLPDLRNAVMLSTDANPGPQTLEMTQADIMRGPQYRQLSNGVAGRSDPGDGSDGLGRDDQLGQSANTQSGIDAGRSDDGNPNSPQQNFRQGEIAQQNGAGSVAGSSRVAVSGDSISSILGTSNPQAIGNFIRANGLTSSTIVAGQNYFLPDDRTAYGDSAALGQAVLNGDNARLAQLAQQRIAADIQNIYDFVRPTQAQRDADPNYAMAKNAQQQPSYANAASPGSSGPQESPGHAGLEPGDYVGAGLAGYTAITDVAIERAGVKSAAAYGVKYGIPALVSDLPNAVGGAISLIDTAKAYHEGKNEEAVNKGTAGLGAIAGAEAGAALGAVAGFGTPAELVTVPVGTILGALGGAYGGQRFGQWIQKIGFEGFFGAPKVEQIQKIPLPSPNELKNHD